MKSIERSKKPEAKKGALICGNGGSMKKIFYDRVPSDVDIFRCNQFYLEDRYFIGRNIKYALFSQSVRHEQLYTFNMLNKTNQYNIENIFLSSYPAELFYEGERIHENSTLDFIDTIAYFASTLAYFKVRFNKIPTTGMIMILFAIALGYTHIYIAGIDFYTQKENYFFNTNKENLSIKFPAINIRNYQHPIHSQDIEILTLKMACNYLNVALKNESNLNCIQDYHSTQKGNIYSVADSKINDYLDLAPKITHHFNNEIEIKKDYIDDLLIPQDTNKWRQDMIYENIMYHQGHLNKNVFTRGIGYFYKQFIDYIGHKKMIFSYKRKLDKINKLN